jgi:TRAP-type mannitol/chloroaromatic compound transport system permease small subunit
MASRTNELLERIDNMSAGVGKGASYLGFVLVATVLYEVVARYLFNAPTIWSFQMTKFLYGGTYLLGGAWVLKQDRHIRIDVLSTRLSPRAKAIVSLACYSILFFPLMLTLFGASIGDAVWSWRMQEHEALTNWQAPLYPIKTVIPFAVLLFILQGIAEFIRTVRFLRGGTPS